LLASDTDFSTAKAWASFGKKKFMGREYEGIFRNTFVLDENDKVIEVFESVTPKGHAKEVLDFLDSKKTSKQTVIKVAAKSNSTKLKKPLAKTKTKKR
jgi:peroxiredoxin